MYTGTVDQQGSRHQTITQVPAFALLFWLSSHYMVPRSGMCGRNRRAAPPNPLRPYTP